MTKATTKLLKQMFIKNMENQAYEHRKAGSIKMNLINPMFDLGVGAELNFSLSFYHNSEGPKETWVSSAEITKFGNGDVYGVSVGYFLQKIRPTGYEWGQIEGEGVATAEFTAKLGASGHNPTTCYITDFSFIESEGLLS